MGFQYLRELLEQSGSRFIIRSENKVGRYYYVKALVGPNTREGEKPWRVTLFDTLENNKPLGHVEMSDPEDPQGVIDKYASGIKYHLSHGARVEAEKLSVLRYEDSDYGTLGRKYGFQAKRSLK